MALEEFILDVFPANPSPGQDLSSIVPAGTWRLLHMRVGLTTSAAVANRIMAFCVRLGPSGIPVMFCYAGFNHVASTTQSYIAHRGGPQSAALVVNPGIQIPTEIIVVGGDQIQTGIAAIDVADQIVSATYRLQRLWRL